MSEKPGVATPLEDGGGVMALLERVAGLMDSVQAAQQRMEERQLELEATVRNIQSEVLKLSGEHANTGATVDRLLEKTRKVSRHVKDVRVRVENQNLRVKKVEATQGDLLAKNKFRVVIYQVGHLTLTHTHTNTYTGQREPEEGLQHPIRVQGLMSHDHL